MSACTDEVGYKILRHTMRGISTEDLCRRFGITLTSFYRWRREYRQRLDRHDHIFEEALDSSNLGGQMGGQMVDRYECRMNTDEQVPSGPTKNFNATLVTLVSAPAGF